MRAFLISKNGKQLCIAGVHEGILHVSVSWVGGKDLPIPNGEDISLSIGGLESQLGTHVEWKARRLKPGDKITIEIIDSDQVDPEPKRIKRKVPTTTGTKAKRNRSNTSQMTDE
jgi:hypothetical protein